MNSEFISLTASGVVIWNIRHGLIAGMYRAGNHTALVYKSRTAGLPFYVDETPEEIIKRIRQASHE